MVLRVVILGAGISGLALGWFLQKKCGDAIQLIILEKSPRPGGWIRTEKNQGFLFENGPRSCRTKGNGIHTLQLLEELGLGPETIPSDPSAKKRYIYLHGKLEPLPYSMGSFLFSPLMKGVFRGALHDLFARKSVEADESIHSFISRRFNPTVMEHLFDPLVTGIYAGNPKELSLRACFPALYEYEQNYGSVLKGALLAKKQAPPQTLSAFVKKNLCHPMFSMVGGLETLPQALAKKLEKALLFGTQVKQLVCHADRVEVVLSDQTRIEANHVFSALPAYALGEVLAPQIPAAASLLHSIPFASVAVVNLGFSSIDLPLEGFGYLVPSNQNEDVLGMVWDSSVFPLQNSGKNARLTVMIGGSRMNNLSDKTDADLVEMSLKAVRKHMGMAVQPAAYHVCRADRAIPQYIVGHRHNILTIKDLLDRQSERLQILGSSYDGVSVNDCIAEAKKMANTYHEKILF